jgi:hypothetical protein
MASVEFSGMIREDASAGPSPFREVWNMTKPKSGQRLAGGRRAGAAVGKRKRGVRRPQRGRAQRAIDNGDMATPSSPFSFLDGLFEAASASGCSLHLGGPRDPAPRGAVPEPRAACRSPRPSSGCKRQKGRVVRVPAGASSTMRLVATPAGLLDLAPEGAPPDLTLTVTDDSPWTSHAPRCAATSRGAHRRRRAVGRRGQLAGRPCPLGPRGRPGPRDRRRARPHGRARPCAAWRGAAPVRAGTPRPGRRRPATGSAGGAE